MDEKTKPEFDILLLSLREERNMLGELGEQLKLRINLFRGVGLPPTATCKKDEIGGLLGQFEMEIIEIQEIRRSLESTLKELNTIVG